MGPFVGVALGLGVDVRVAVAAGVAVRLGVTVGTRVAVALGFTVGLGVADGMVSVLVAVGAEVGVAVGAGLGALTTNAQKAIAPHAASASATAPTMATMTQGPRPPNLAPPCVPTAGAGAQPATGGL